MSDIEMTTDDTLELDAIIEEWSDPQSVIQKHNVDSNNYNLKGFKTHTGVFDPQESGTYEFNINGQILSIKVTDSILIPNGAFIKYKFEDDSNTSEVKDYIGSKPSTISGNVSYVSGKVGNYSVSLDGASSTYIYRSSALDKISKSTDYSFIMWAKLDSVSSEQSLLSNSNGGKDRVSLHYPSRNDSSGDYSITFRQYTGNKKKKSYLNPPTDTWLHIACTWNSSSDTPRLFVNGTEYNDSGGGTAESGNDNFVIGANDSKQINFQGTIDSFIGFDNTLSQTQIRDHYNSTK